MGYSLFFVSLFGVMIYVCTKIFDDVEVGRILGGVITILIMGIWLLASLILDTSCLRERTLINTNAIVYNKNNGSYVYITKEANVYKLIRDDSTSDVSSYDTSKTEIIISDENILETYTEIPANKILKVLFDLSDKPKYVIKTNEIKMILQ